MSWRPRTTGSHARRAALRDDPAAIERVARAELGWVQPGEIVVDLGEAVAKGRTVRARLSASGRLSDGALRPRRRWRSPSAARSWCCSGAAGSPTSACRAPICAGWPRRHVLTAMLAFKIPARVRTTERRRTPRREAISDAELGLLLLTTVYLLLAFSGGVTSAIYPLVYAVVSFLVTFHRLGRRAAAGRGGHRLRGGALLRSGGAARGGGRLPGARRLHRRVRAVERRLSARRGGAPAPRAPAPPRGRGGGDARGGARLPPHHHGAVVREPRAHAAPRSRRSCRRARSRRSTSSSTTTCDLLRTALRLQTCALLWLDESGERLKVKELCTDSPHIAEGAIPAGGGVLGAILKELRPFVLESPRLSLLPYYARPGDGRRVRRRAGGRGAHGARHPGRRSRPASASSTKRRWR